VKKQGVTLPKPDPYRKNFFTKTLKTFSKISATVSSENMGHSLRGDPRVYTMQ
jgi:hypothetical protein